MENGADLTLVHDLKTPAGSLSFEGNLNKAEDFLKLSAALGRQLNHGWELSGQAAAMTKWEGKQPLAGRWNGRIGFHKANFRETGVDNPRKNFVGGLGRVPAGHVRRLC